MFAAEFAEHDAWIKKQPPIPQWFIDGKYTPTGDPVEGEEMKFHQVENCQTGHYSDVLTTIFRRNSTSTIPQ